MSSSGPSSGSRPPASFPRLPPPPSPSPSLAIPPTVYRPSLPLSLTIRFSTHIPDLHLDIPHPSATSIASLRQTIRSRLPTTASTRRLRFIHAGKILSSTSVLSAVVRAAPPPPPTSEESDARGKGKGKEPEGAGPTQRMYVNCSIGDTLTAKQLEDEAEEAIRPVPDAASARSCTPLSSVGSPSPGPDADAYTTAASSLLQRRAQRPQGFDRLLSSGFTATEVHSLRLQFRGITAARHTADTMPSPDGMRRLEDAWMDSNHTGGGAPALAMGVGPGGIEEAEGGDGAGAMIDMLVMGMLIGFVWPLGCAGWLLKEQGMLGQNFRYFVVFGFMLVVLVGMVKSFSG